MVKWSVKNPSVTLALMSELLALTHRGHFLYILLRVSFCSSANWKSVSLCEQRCQRLCPCHFVLQSWSNLSSNEYWLTLSLCAFPVPLCFSEWVLRRKNAAPPPLNEFRSPPLRPSCLKAPDSSLHRGRSYSPVQWLPNTQRSDQSPPASDSWWQHRDKGGAANKTLRGVIIKVQLGEESGRSTDAPASKENSRVVSLTALLVYDNYDICV